MGSRAALSSQRAISGLRAKFQTPSALSSRMADECIFCRIVENRSMVPHWLAESDKALAFLDINPIRTGHTLVIPKAHAVDLRTITDGDWAAVAGLSARVVNLLRRKLGTTGENLFVASGPGSEQSVFHLHVHIIPRSPDD